MLKTATAGVVWKEGQILIAKRSKDQFWEFPGGHIEPGETPEQCLVREMKEELNIIVKVEKILGKIEGYFRGRNMVLYAFQAQWVEGQLELLVHSEIRWVLPIELDGFTFIEEDREVVRLLKSSIKDPQKT